MLATAQLSSSLLGGANLLTERATGQFQQPTLTSLKVNGFFTCSDGSCHSVRPTGQKSTLRASTNFRSSKLARPLRSTWVREISMLKNTGVRHSEGWTRPQRWLIRSSLEGEVPDQTGADETREVEAEQSIPTTSGKEKRAFRESKPLPYAQDAKAPPYRLKVKHVVVAASVAAVLFALWPFIGPELKNMAVYGPLIVLGTVGSAFVLIKDSILFSIMVVMRLMPTHQIRVLKVVMTLLAYIGDSLRIALLFVLDAMPVPPVALGLFLAATVVAVADAAGADAEEIDDMAIPTAALGLGLLLGKVPQVLFLAGLLLLSLYSFARLQLLIMRGRFPEPVPTTAGVVLTAVTPAAALLVAVAASPTAKALAVSLHAALAVVSFHTSWKPSVKAKNSKARQDVPRVLQATAFAIALSVGVRWFLRQNLQWLAA